MKTLLVPFIAFILPLLPFSAQAQKIKAIYVHLYTDSLKKGTYNYINIDGETEGGHFLPLDTSHLEFSSNEGKFFGNQLYIPADFQPKKVTVHAVLRADPAQQKTFTIYVKQLPDPPLPNETQSQTAVRRSRGRG